MDLSICAAAACRGSTAGGAGALQGAVTRDRSCAVSHLAASLCSAHSPTSTPHTGDPSADELRSGVNLDTAGKCSCNATYCAAFAKGSRAFTPDGNLRDTVTITGQLAPNPYEDLRDAPSSRLFCVPPCESCCHTAASARL